MEIQRRESGVYHEHSSTAISWDTCADLKEMWGVSWVGYIKIEEEADYNLQLSSDDSSWVYIDGTLRVSVTGCKTPNTPSFSETFHLTKGYHYFIGHYTQSTNQNSFELSIKKGTGAYKVMDNSMFYYGKIYIDDNSTFKSVHSVVLHGDIHNKEGDK